MEEKEYSRGYFIVDEWYERAYPGVEKTLLFRVDEKYRPQFSAYAHFSDIDQLMEHILQSHIPSLNQMAQNLHNEYLFLLSIWSSTKKPTEKEIKLVMAAIGDLYKSNMS